ncbi:hypothetical protein QOT17_017101 [Balamuthia mandrillaris]
MKLSLALAVMVFGFLCVADSKRPLNLEQGHIHTANGEHAVGWSDDRQQQAATNFGLAKPPTPEQIEEAERELKKKAKGTPLSIAPPIETEDPPLLTIFTTLKPADKGSAEYQRQKNALSSWLKLVPQPDVIVFGDDFGASVLVEELEKEFEKKIYYVPEVQRNQYRMPYVNDIFSRANKMTSSPWLMFSNADIVHTQSLMDTLHVVNGKRRHAIFLSSTPTEAPTKDSSTSTPAVNHPKDKDWQDVLLVGKTHKVSLDKPLFNEHLDTYQFNQEWTARLLTDALSPNSIVGSAWQVDYFVFTKNFWRDIGHKQHRSKDKQLREWDFGLPPFVMGAQGYTNWLLHRATLEKKATVDITETALAFNAQHEWVHDAPEKREMKKYNEELAGSWYLGNIEKTAWLTQPCAPPGEGPCLHWRSHYQQQQQQQK